MSTRRVVSLLSAAGGLKICSDQNGSAVPKQATAAQAVFDAARMSVVCPGKASSSSVASTSSVTVAVASDRSDEFAREEVDAAVSVINSSPEVLSKFGGIGEDIVIGPEFCEILHELANDPEIVRQCRARLTNTNTSATTSATTTSTSAPSSPSLVPPNSWSSEDDPRLRRSLRDLGAELYSSSSSSSSSRSSRSAPSSPPLFSSSSSTSPSASPSSASSSSSLSSSAIPSLPFSRAWNELTMEFCCGICQDVQAAPETFSCSHSFCKCCIEDLRAYDEKKASGTAKKTSALIFTCPLCHQEVKSRTTLHHGWTSTIEERVMQKEHECISTCEEEERAAFFLNKQEWLERKARGTLSRSVKKIKRAQKQKNLGTGGGACSEEEEVEYRHFCIIVAAAVVFVVTLLTATRRSSK